MHNGEPSNVSQQLSPFVFEHIISVWKRLVHVFCAV